MGIYIGMDGYIYRDEWVYIGMDGYKWGVYESMYIM